MHILWLSTYFTTCTYFFWSVQKQFPCENRFLEMYKQCRIFSQWKYCKNEILTTKHTKVYSCTIYMYIHNFCQIWYLLILTLLHILSFLFFVCRMDVKWCPWSRITSLARKRPFHWISRKNRLPWKLQNFTTGHRF